MAIIRLEPKENLREIERITELIKDIRTGLSEGKYIVSGSQRMEVEERLDEYERYARSSIMKAFGYDARSRPGSLYLIRRDLTLIELELEGKVTSRS